MINIICGKCKTKYNLTKIIEKLDKNPFYCECGKTLVPRYIEWNK